MIFTFELVSDDQLLTMGPGEEYEDAVHASEIADDLAKELLIAEPQFRDFTLIVRDDHDDEVYRVRLDETIH